jgi:hypothetical protein
VDEPARPSRYDRLRRVLAPIAVVIALVLLVRETTSKRDADRGTIELRFGAHAAEVTHVRADVLDATGAPVGYVERDLRADPTTPIRFPAEVGDRARIVIDLRTTRGPRRFEHALSKGDEVVVDVGADLAAP